MSFAHPRHRKDYMNHKKPRFFSAVVCVVTASVSLFSIPALAQSARQVLQRHVRVPVATGQAPRVGSLPSEQRLHLSILLPLRNQGELTALLARLYDPSSSDYRRFLSVEEFTRRFGPAAEDYQAVVDFAQAQGFTVTDRPANRMLVPIVGTAAQVEKAFHVSMNLYQHPTESRPFYSPDREPALDLKVRVAHIAGLNNFSIPRPLVTKAASRRAGSLATGSGPGGSYLASDMRAAYYGGTTLTGAGQVVGLLEFDGFDMADVNSTFSAAGQTYSVPIHKVLVNGATGDPTWNYGFGPDTEQVLDIVQAIGMAPGLSQVRVYIGNPGMGLDDAAIFNAMATENIAKQIAVSWAWTPEDPAIDDPIFQEFAAQGQSLFVASGDRGAFDENVSPFFYPADDVYVTSVGGTHLTTNGAGGSWASESAWNSPQYACASGGGVSPDGIEIPSWQTGVANASNRGSTILRNVPDVAMEADFDNLACDQFGCYEGAAGTSFAAPRWAGFMALVNEQAVANGGRTVGFINPTLYAIGRGSASTYAANFHDITSGTNRCCDQPVFYEAVSGYDLVTGWGTPTGQSLIDALAGDRSPRFTLTTTPGALSLNKPVRSATSTITVTNVGGFSGNVALAVSGLPSGVTASFSANPTSGTSTLTLTASDTAAPGPALLTITGTSGALTATANIALTVDAPGFLLHVMPEPAIVFNGGSTTATVTVTELGGFKGSVNLSVSGLPSGVTASFDPNPTTTTSKLTLTASPNATASNVNAMLTITGASSEWTASTTLSLSVNGANFFLSDRPDGATTGWGSVTILQGTSGTLPITVVPLGGFTGQVSLGWLLGTVLPPGVTASFSPNPTSRTSTLTLTASSVAATGTTMLGLLGVSGGRADLTFLYVTVNPASTLSVALAGTGAGKVTSSPAGINCGAACSAVYGPETTITLNAAAAVGSTFTGWGGACTGTGACTVTMDAARWVTATFDSPNPPLPPPVRINTGGGTAGNFLADAYFSGGIAATYTNAIDTSLIPAPVPPQAVLQSERYGVMTYSLPLFVPNSRHTVALYFVENYATAAGQRRFNVGINGTQVLSNFDVYAAAGARRKAVERVFSTVANASGTIVIQFSAGSANNPEINGIAVDQSPGPFAINAGGAATGRFGGDVAFSGGSTAATTAAIDTSLIPAPVPPQAVFQTERYGAFNYTVSGYAPGSSHAVTLYFAEIYWGAAGQRMFDVSINDAQVLKNFDIVATAGAKNRAIQSTFRAVANSSGKIVIQFSVGAANQPKVSGIVIDQDAGNPVLRVTQASNGAGTVTSSPDGIDCGPTCSASYPPGTVVTLAAAPTADSTFAGWNGACVGAATACTLTMNADQSVTATFKPKLASSLSVALLGSGAGTVTSLPVGINCGSDCQADYPPGTVVTLTETAAPGSWFAGWHGACFEVTGDGACTVTMSEAQSVTATFNLVSAPTLTYYGEGSGAGGVFSSPAGIDCGFFCSASFAPGAVVTLTAVAQPGSAFVRWSGACSGTSETCVVTMDADQTVAAQFDFVSGPILTLKVVGPGSIVGDLHCDATCNFPLLLSQAVWIQAWPAPGSTFTGWSGACAGSNSVCSVWMMGSEVVTATFGGGPVSINAGGKAADSFVADTGFSGGNTASTTAVIDTSLIPSPVPPQAVFQTERYGTFTYTLDGYAPGSTHVVTLYFAEIYWGAAGQRRFNVSINGTRVLSNFDIVATTGAKNKAIQETFNTVANDRGQIAIQFSVGGADQPKVSGIAIQ